MASKIYLQGITVHIEKGAVVYTYPMAQLSYSLQNSTLSIYKNGKLIMFDASNVISDIDASLLANDAAVHAYLGQFIGNTDLSSASNSTHSSVASVATTDTLLLAANEHRVKVFIYNNSTSTLYVKYGTGASATSFAQIQVAAGVLIPITGYKGVIHFFHSALNGTIEVTEVHI